MDVLFRWQLPVIPANRSLQRARRDGLSVFELWIAREDDDSVRISKHRALSADQSHRRIAVESQTKVGIVADRRTT